MNKSKENIKIILFQFRLAKEMREQELRCYNEYSSLRPDQIITHYLLEDDFNIEDLKNYDGIIIGGTGDFGVYDVKEKYPKAFEQLKQIAEHCKEKSIPVLTVCMQFWAVIFGGEVESDITKKEVGTITIKTTPEAKDDPLFFDMPDKFLGHVGHKDHISQVPKGGVVLAYSDLCPTHAIRFHNTYILQFHPELNPKTMKERMDAYPSYVKDNPEEYYEALNSLVDAPENNAILKRWIERIIMK